jgi:hypothetical protein
LYSKNQKPNIILVGNHPGHKPGIRRKEAKAGEKYFDNDSPHRSLAFFDEELK